MKRIQIIGIILIFLAMLNLIKYFTLPVIFQILSYKGGIDSVHLAVIVNTVLSYAVLLVVLILSIAMTVFAKASQNKMVYNLAKSYLGIFLTNTFVGIIFAVYSNLIASGTIALPSSFENISDFMTMVGAGMGLISLVLQLLSLVLLIIILVKNQSHQDDEHNQESVL